jgi:8-oxo-dGTP pyrophosphatase MutT (NUDIX family)
MSFDPLFAIYRNFATMVQRVDRVYPAAVESHRDGTPLGLAVLAERPLQIDPGLRAAGQQHLQEVAARSSRMHDGRVLAFVAADGFPLVCGHGGYFDAIATSDSLRAEYLDFVADEGTKRAGLDALPLRRLAHEVCGGDPLRSGSGRVAAIGVSVAVTVPAARGRALLLGLRSHTVATDPDMWHVAPSGTLEPGGTDPVIDVVERELCEELGVRLEEPAALSTRLRPLGIGFDLLRLRPEICLQLDLTAQDIPAEGIVVAPGEFQDRCLVELSNAGLSEFWDRHPPETLTPAAAATIALLEIGRREL